MILYHFAPAHLVSQILQDGLTLGTFPLYEDGELQFLPRCQWLTLEPDERKQSWATKSLIDYNRTAYRLTIAIPDSHHKKLIRASDFIRGFPQEACRLIEDWPGSDKWYIFRGRIPPKWILGCHAVKSAGEQHAVGGVKSNGQL